MRLGPRGRSLWQTIVKGLPAGWELDERELLLLWLAARQADVVQRLEVAVKRDGEMVTGSQAQPVLHPAVGEARQGRLAVSRLLGDIEMPGAEAEPRTVAGVRGQRAARARWERRDRVREARDGA